MLIGKKEGSVVKRVFAFLVIAMVSVQLFASAYRINEYSFDVDGKTKKVVLSEFIGEPGDTFGSEDELKKFLDDKRQQLLNKRVFLSVEYTYELQQTGIDEYDANVVFHVKDSKTFIVIPFPKYDSNYGFSFKAKAKDTNFLGTFTTMESTAVITQQDNSFEESLVQWDFSVDSLRIKESKLTFSHDGALNFQNWTNSYAGATARISNVIIHDTVWNGSVSFNFYPNVNDRSSDWKPKSVSTSIGVSFMNSKLSGASATNSLSYAFSDKLFTTNTSFSYMMSEKLKIESTSNFYTTQYGFEDGLNYISVGTGVRRGFTLFKKVSFYPNLMFNLGYALKTKVWDPYYVLSLPFSYGRIDWVGINFRKGFSFSITGIDTYHFLNNTEGFHSLSLSGSATAHYPVTSWFNPSARVNFILANYNLGINAGNSYSWNMRGIRDDNEVINTARKFGMTLNMDFMFNFITLKNFCHTYAIPFVDVFVGSDGNDGFEKLITIGGEGIIIVDNHPSYPIRGSLGINALDLLNFVKGDIGIRDVEFELFIGMYFLY